MRRTIAMLLAATAGTLTLTAAGSAATVTVQIKSTGFSPATITINHGDTVTWKNVDTVDHQVVADDGSFASLVLHAGRTWSTTLTTAGTFRYHDALYPKRTGKITVKGPPPSVSLALTAPIVFYGTPVTLSGTISSGAVGQTVSIEKQPYGQAAPGPLAVVKTGAGGAYSFTVAPDLYTTYVAHWGAVSSASVVVQVAPKVRLLAGGGGYMKVTISSPVSLWHRHVALQRLSPFGQWVSLANLTLGEQNGRLFRPASYIPKGPSRIRVFLSVNQAGLGLLASHSGIQKVVRRR
jgi:plastocyanin